MIGYKAVKHKLHLKMGDMVIGQRDGQLTRCVVLRGGKDSILRPTTSDLAFAIEHFEWVMPLPKGK